MFVLKIIKKIFAILGSTDSPRQVAWGFVLGMILGLTPFWNVHNLLIVLLILLFHVNLGSAIFGWFIFSAFAYLLDPLFHSLGYYLLVQVDSLQSIWTFIYNNSVLAWFRFNNTVVLGSLLTGLILLAPTWFLMRWFVQYYRKYLQAKVQKLKIVQVLKSSKIYTAYQKVKILGA